MSMIWRIAVRLDLVFGRGNGVGRQQTAKMTRRLTASKQPPDPLTQRFNTLFGAYLDNTAAYLPQNVSAPVLVCVTADGVRMPGFDPAPWRRLFKTLTIATVPGDHGSCLTSEAPPLAAAISRYLSALDPAQPPGPAPAGTDRPSVEPGMKTTENAVPGMPADPP
jgi:thioesterase domain-containing protein